MIPTLADILSHVATVTIDGVVVRPETALTLKPMRGTIDVKTATIGTLRKLQMETGFEITFKPDGRVTQGIVNVLHPYRFLDIGRTTGAAIFIPQASGINTGTDVLTYSVHGLTTGTAVALGATWTAPTVAGGFPRGVLRYVRRIDNDTFTLHTTSGDAAANTGKVNFTALGQGSLIVVRMRPVVIHSTLGFKLTFHNCAVTAMPNLRIGAGVSLWEPVTIRAYHTFGAAPGADTLFTVEEAAFTDTAISEAEYIYGTPAVATDGAGGLRTALPVGATVEIDFTLNAAEQTNDAQGPMGQTLTSIDARLKVTVPGMSWGETLAALQLTEARGSAITETLVEIVWGPANFYATFALEAPELNASAEGAAVGPLTFALVRQHTDGIPSAWYQFDIAE